MAHNFNSTTLSLGLSKAWKQAMPLFYKMAGPHQVPTFQFRSLILVIGWLTALHPWPGCLYLQLSFCFSFMFLSLMHIDSSVTVWLDFKRSDWCQFQQLIYSIFVFAFLPSNQRAFDDVWLTMVIVLALPSQNFAQDRLIWRAKIQGEYYPRHASPIIVQSTGEVRGQGMTMIDYLNIIPHSIPHQVEFISNSITTTQEVRNVLERCVCIGWQISPFTSSV